ncbi:MAG: S8 family serine peptidase [Lachnospiraceae bacterium]|nr:S8 family serine peptidase [Lachnospiraceae bacterium]
MKIKKFLSIILAIIITLNSSSLSALAVNNDNLNNFVIEIDDEQINEDEPEEDNLPGEDDFDAEPNNEEDIEDSDEPEEDFADEAALLNIINDEPDDVDYVGGEIIIVLESSVTRGFARMSTEHMAEALEETLSEYPGLIDEVAVFADNQTLATALLPEGMSVEEAIAEYEKSPLVKYAQPNYVYDLMTEPIPAVPFAAVPNDSLTGNPRAYYLSWIRTYQAWEILANFSGRPKVRVAVIDSQIDLNHEDLQKNILKNLAVNIQNSNWNDVSKWKSYNSPDAHGTHVAGLIAADANNSKGIAGVASGMNNNIVDIIPINVFEWDDGEKKYGSAFTTSIIKAIDYAVKNEAKVINMSLGMATDNVNYDNAFKAAIDSAVSKGVVVVAAAGNEGNDDNYVFPSDWANVISIINVRDINTNTIPNSYYQWHNGVYVNENPRHSTSSFGSLKNMSAPGASVLSTVPGNNYASMNGTSMASPVVAAVAAMIRYGNPNLTVAEVTNILQQTATDVHTVGKDDQTGWGIVHAERAISATVAPKISVSAINPFSNRLTITGTSTNVTYNIYRKVGSSGTYTLHVSNVSPPTNSFNYTDADNVNPGTQYFYQVTTNVSELESLRSTEQSITTASAATTRLAAAAVSGTAFRTNVSWNAVSVSGLPAPAYTLERKLSSESDSAYTTIFNNGIESALLTGLSFQDTSAMPGTQYVYRITPYWQFNGVPRASVPFVSALYNAPVVLAPTNLRASVNTAGTAVSLTWSRLTNATNYIIYRKLDTEAENEYQIIGSITASSATVAYNDTSVAWGEVYDYRVAAVNQLPVSTLEGNKSTPVSVRFGPISASLNASFSGKALSPFEIELKWSAEPDRTYKVYRRLTAAAVWEEIASGVSASGDNVIYVDNADDAGLVPGRAYRYSIASVDSAGKTSVNSVERIVSAGALRAPGVPAVVASGPNNAAVTWTASSMPPAEYEIHRRLTGGNNDFTKVGSVPGNFLTWTDWNVTNSTSYQYKVIAVWQLGKSESGVRAWNSPAALPRLAVPTGLRAASLRPTEVVFSWARLANVATYNQGAAGYELSIPGHPDVAKRTKKIYNADIANLALANITTSIDGLHPSTAYGVSIRAFWERAGEPFEYGAYSNEVIFSTTGPAPSGLRVAPNSANDISLKPTSVRLQWNAVRGTATVPIQNPTGYTVYRNGERIGNVLDNSVNTIFEFTDNGQVPGLTPGVATGYTVQAYWGTAGTPEIPGTQPGALSTVLTVIPPGLAPSGLAFTAGRVRATSVEITWTRIIAGVNNVNHHNFVGYNIYVNGSTTPDNPSPITHNMASSYTVQNLIPRTANTVRVVGVWNTASGQREGISASRAVTTTGPAPTGFKVIGPTSPTSTTLTWNDLSLNTGNVLQVEGFLINKNGIPYDYKKYDESINGVWTWTDDNLTPGVTARYTIQTCWGEDATFTGTTWNGNGLLGILSNAVTVIPPGPIPAGIRALNITPIGFTLDWNNITGVANLNGLEGYHVYVNNQLAATIPYDALTKPSIESGFFVPGSEVEIRPNTNYQVKVAGVWNGIEGRQSAIVNVRTVGSAPSGFRATRTALTSADFRWNGVTFNPDGYIIRHFVNGEIVDETTEAHIDGKTIYELNDKMEKLIPGTANVFTVQAYWDDVDKGGGIVSNAVTVTPAGGALDRSRITQTNQGADRLRIIWNSASAVNHQSISIACYKWSLYDGEVLVREGKTTTAAQTQSDIITGLIPNKVYTAQVQTILKINGTDVYGSRVSNNVRTAIGAAPTWVNNTVTPTSVTLNWNPVANAAGYEVFKTTVVNAAFTHTSVVKAAGVTDVIGTSWTDSTVNPGVRVRYFVRALWATDSMGNVPGNVSVVRDIIPNGAAPSWVSSGVTNDKVTLTWKAPASANDVKGYAIYRIDNSTNAAFTHPDVREVKRVANNVFTWTDEDVLPGQSIRYFVCSLYGNDNRPGTPTVGRNIRILGTNPAAPTGLRMIAGTLTGSSVRIAWNPVNQRVNNQFVSGYLITRTEVANPNNIKREYITLQEYQNRGNAWTDNSLIPSIQVRYTVQACWENPGKDLSGNWLISEARPGSSSAILTVTPPGVAPAGVRVTIRNPVEISVSWNAVPNVAGAEFVGYDVYLYEGTGVTRNPNPIDENLKVKGLTANFADLTPGMQYSVNVVPIWKTNAGGNDEFEGRASVFVNARTAGPAPTALRAVNVTNAGVVLQWTPPANAEAIGVKGYLILRNGVVFDYVSLNDHEGKNFSWIDERPLRGTAVNYSVRACWEESKSMDIAGNLWNGDGKPGNVSGVTRVTAPWV